MDYGEDFAYESAGTWFKQMDKLIHYVNKDGRVNAFYSIPTIYTEEKYTSNESWPLKTDDFFPYADYSNVDWTGYFINRPSLKSYVRKLSGFLQAAKQLKFLVGRNKEGPNTDSLEEAMALVQQHCI
jgi:alpha-mannosidase